MRQSGRVLIILLVLLAVSPLTAQADDNELRSTCSFLTASVQLEPRLLEGDGTPLPSTPISTENLSQGLAQIIFKGLLPQPLAAETLSELAAYEGLTQSISASIQRNFTRSAPCQLYSQVRLKTAQDFISQSHQYLAEFSSQSQNSKDLLEARQRDSAGRILYFDQLFVKNQEGAATGSFELDSNQVHQCINQNRNELGQMLQQEAALLQDLILKIYGQSSYAHLYDLPRRLSYQNVDLEVQKVRKVQIEIIAFSAAGPLSTWLGGVGLGALVGEGVISAPTAAVLTRTIPALIGGVMSAKTGGQVAGILADRKGSSLQANQLNQYMQQSWDVANASSEENIAIYISELSAQAQSQQKFMDAYVKILTDLKNSGHLPAALNKCAAISPSLTE